MPNNNKNQALSRGRRRRNSRQAPNNLPARAPSSYAPPNTIRNIGLYPRICITRTVEGGLYDITADGINPTLAAINFSLNDVPGYTEFTAMFQTYCIEEVSIWWRPEYTVLSDASALSNSVNVEFNSAIDVVDSSAPSSVDSVLEYQSCAHTSIVQTHFRKIHPAVLIDGVSPTCQLVSCASPSTNWYGVKIGISPTGIAMKFRAVARYKIALVGLK